MDTTHGSTGLRLYLLGGFRAERDGEPLASSWHRPTARALVKLLAVTPNHQLLRDQIIEALWPNLDLDAADLSFRKALSWARHALEPELSPRTPSAHLHLTGQVVSLDPSVWVDVDELERRASSALESGAPDLLEQALSLYGGELLPEDRYEAWAEERRSALTDLHTNLLLRLARALSTSGRARDAVLRLREALKHDPAREEVHRELMRLHAVSGSREQALRQYRACCRVLRETYDVAPEPETIALYDAIRSGALQAPVDVPLPAPLQHEAPVGFVGRERPRDILARTLADGEEESGRPVVAVGGEAGVGKSRLVAEVARMAAAEGALVLWGAGYEQEGQLPYGPVVEAMSGYVASLSPAQRMQLGERYPALSRLLPEIGSDTAPAPPLQSEGNRTWLFATVSRLLSDLRATRPVLLVLDDLHSADPPTLQLVHYLARHAHEHRCPLFVTFREEQVLDGSSLGDLLAAMSRAGLLRRLTLLPLARPESDALVARLPPDAEPAPSLLDHVFQLSMGNPLFAIQLLYELRESQDIELREGRWHLRSSAARDLPARVPGQIRELVAARVERMGEASRRALSLAAVAGMESSFSVLAAAAASFSPAWSEDDLVDAMDEALTARILEEREGGYAFQHPLFRAALYHRLSQRRRMRLHLAVAEALERLRPDEVEPLAHHFALSDDETRACVYLERAGDRAASVYANDAAESHFSELVHRFERLDRMDDAASIREKLATVLRTVSRFDGALEVLERAVEYYRSAGDDEALGRVVAQIGRVYAFRGDADAGIEHLQPVIVELERREPSSGLAMLYASLAALYFPAGRYAESAGAATRACEIARALDEKRVLADALRHLATALGLLGRAPEGIQPIQESVALSEAIGDFTVLPVALNNIGAGYMVLGDLEQNRVYRERALQAAGRVGEQAWIGAATATLGQAHYYLGDWEQARRRANESVSILGTLGETWYMAYPLLYIGTVDVAEGKWESAAHHLEEAIKIADRSRDLQALRWAAVPRAELDLVHGRVADAIARLEELRDSPGRQDRDVIFLLSSLAVAYLETGENEEAEAVVSEAIERAAGQELRLFLTDALRVEGMLRARQERWPEAEKTLQRACDLARSMAYPYAEARALYELGQALVCRGDAEPGRRHLRQALTLFRRLGAQPYVQNTQEILRTPSTPRTA